MPSLSLLFHCAVHQLVLPADLPNATRPQQALEDQQTLQELCEQWQQLEQQRWTTAELQRRRARLALDYPGDALEDEMFGEQVSMIYGATTNKQGFKVRTVVGRVLCAAWWR